MAKYSKVFSTGLTNVSADEFHKNYTVVRMTRYGMSDAAICKQTGLTHGQVSGRIGLYGLRGHRRAVRHGFAAEGEEITALAMSYNGREITADTKKYNKLRNDILKARRKKQTKLGA